MNSSHEGRESNLQLSRAGALLARYWTLENRILLILFVVNLLLVSPQFIPGFDTINPFDEAKYIESGRRLIVGSMRDFAWSPLTSILYAPLYMAVRHSLDWFVELAALGRLTLFSIMWLCFMFLAKKLRGHFPPLLMAGLILVETTFTQILSNPSDALFCAMSAAALAWVVDFIDSRRLSSVWLASAFVGLATLSRNDGLFLLPFFVLILIAVSIRRHIHVLRIVMASGIPFAVLVFGYISVFWLHSGSFGFGVGNRGLSVYEWSLHRSSGLTSDQLSEQLKGSEPNGAAPSSVVQAMLNDPGLLTTQVRKNVDAVIKNILVAYDKRVGPAMFLFAIAGIIALYRRKDFSLLAALVLWPIHSLLYLAFYIRIGFLLLDHFVIFVLACAGINYLITDVRNSRLRVIWSFVFIILGTAGLVAGKLALVPAGVFVLAGLWMAWLLVGEERSDSRLAAAFAVLAAVGLILHGAYSFPNYGSIGQSEPEQAIHSLEELLPPGSLVLSPYPGPAVAARMDDIGPGDVPKSAMSPDSFVPWLKTRGVDAIYLDRRLKGSESFYRLADDLAGNALHVVFASEDERIHVLVPAE